MDHVPRILQISDLLAKKSVFLMGPRRTGKSTLIRHQVKADQVYNLLRADTFQDLSRRPSLIRESLSPKDRVVVIDEIQKLPILMDEIHYMIEEMGIRFLLTGSSLRKLKRTHTSLMAGRARTQRLFPFVSKELRSWKLEERLLYGWLPPVVLSEDPLEELSTYVGDYLREEIQAEALSRRIENFSRFLFTAAQFNAELINFENVARDSQVPARTIREYYQVLVDTLVGDMLEPYQPRKGQGRKPVSHSKFYFFDAGVVHALLRISELPEGAKHFGPAFEQFVFQELQAYRSYSSKAFDLNFWRTQSGEEVDFVLNGEIAIEVKASKLVHEGDLKGLKALQEEQKLRKAIVVSRDPRVRKVGAVEIWPVRHFCEALWEGELA